MQLQCRPELSEQHRCDWNWQNGRKQIINYVCKVCFNIRQYLCSSEGILILVFLWYKATDFRGIGGNCRLAAPTYFSRGILARKLDSFWINFVSISGESGSSLRSKHFRASSSRKLRREQKKEWQGRGREKKEALAHKPHDFEKLRSPTNAASDWCSASSVDYLALETAIKAGMLCLRVSQTWSHVICGRRLQIFIRIVFVPRFMRSESLKYIWRSSSGD